MAIIQHELRFWFREKFAEKRMTQEEFARIFGIPRSTQAMLLSDKNQRKAGLETCLKLAKAFHVDVVNVLEMAGFSKRSDPVKADERNLMQMYRLLDARDKQTIIVFCESLRRLDTRPVMPGRESGRYKGE